MNFFDVLFWMGMLCFFPVIVVIIRDAIKATRLLPEISAMESTSQREVAPLV